MLELDHLTVSGDVTFGKNVSLKVKLCSQIRFLRRGNLVFFCSIMPACELQLFSWPQNVLQLFTLNITTLSLINPESSPTVKETCCFSNVVEKKCREN